MIDLFDRRERKVLAVLAGILLLGLAVLFLVDLSERRGYERAVLEIQSREKQFLPLDVKRNESKARWLAWDAARLDLKEIRDGWFYRGPEAIKQLTLDVCKLLSDAGHVSPDFKYEYQEAAGGKLRKIAIVFMFSGSYPELKKFMDTVERFPKFLMVENVDFAKNYDAVDRMDVKITMAGYYEN